jgi:hypothetical protein
VQNGNLVTRKSAGQTLVVPICGGVGDLEAIHTLNEVGSLVWTLADGRTSVTEMVDAVCAEYAVERGEAEQDVREFLALLQSSGLLRAAPDEPGDAPA